MFLEIDGLSKRFGRTLALDDVSLDVEEGAFVCFLGPSGCGKTTMLRCIAGLEAQDSGDLRQRGRSIADQPPAGRDFGIVFQSYALFPNLTVATNVGYGLTGRGWDRAAQRARTAEMIDLVGLNGQEDKYPAQLSGGQQQRVALARALAPKPAMLLLDEPLSALDAKVRERLRREVKDLQRSLGVTTIMVTHDQEEALTMADQVVVMNAGRIAQIGSPQEIYDNPVNPFVADFIGTMNLLTARSDGNGSLHLGGSCTIRANGALSGTLAPGETVTCAVRPQNLRLCRAGAAGAGCLPARLQTIEYLGSHYRAVLAAEHDAALSLRVDLAPETLAALAPFQGERLTVQLPADALRFFAADTGTARAEQAE